MTTTRPTSKILLEFIVTMFLLSSFFFAGCSSDDPESTREPDASAAVDAPGTITVSSTAMNFHLADTVYSGWNKVTYKNESTDTHFLIFEKYPEGKNIDSAREKVLSVFQEAMDSIQIGKMDAAMQVFGQFPPWFAEVKFLGGTGLISPGHTAQTTLNLIPGVYMMECYVKMPDGKFHSTMGMLKQVVVRSDDSRSTPPDATVSVQISGEGIMLPRTPSAGQQVFKVLFKDQKAHENFVGHDVHLVRYSDTASTKKLEAWMNWMDPKGLVSPAPEGFVFLGGTQEMAAGDSAYFTAELTPGSYALIAEVPEPSKKKMLRKFTVEGK